MKKLYLLSSLMLLASSMYAGENDWYIRGEFNDYDPAGAEEWALTPTVENEKIVSGTFSIPASQFKFNFVNPDDNVFTPINKSFAYINVNVEFTDNVYTGTASLAWDDYDEYYYWIVKDWEGGDITVSIDTTNNNPTVTIVKEEGSSAVNKIETQDTLSPVYNIHGVKVLEENKDLNSLPKGIYIVNGKKVVVR